MPYKKEILTIPHAILKTLPLPKKKRAKFHDNLEPNLPPARSFPWSFTRESDSRLQESQGLFAPPLPAHSIGLSLSRRANGSLSIASERGAKGGVLSVWFDEDDRFLVSQHFPAISPLSPFSTPVIAALFCDRTAFATRPKVGGASGLSVGKSHLWRSAADDAPPRSAFERAWALSSLSTISPSTSTFHLLSSPTLQPQSAPAV